MKPVLVTTKHRGVFFGYMNDDNPDLPASLNLKECRNIVLWSAATRGFLGLAANGPDSDCRIGPAATVTLYDVTSIADVTATAEAKFKEAPWLS